MLVIFIDTNALRGAGWKAAAFASLLRLAADGAVKLITSEIVFNERRTQWIEEHDQRVLKLRKALESIVADPILGSTVKAKFANSLKDVEELQPTKELSKIAFLEYFDSRKIEVIPVDSGHQSEMLEMYFDGVPPFGGVKSRKDIPDAYIFLSARDFNKKNGGFVAVGADEKLREVLLKLEDVVGYSTFDELMSGPEIAEAKEAAENQKAWLAAKRNIPAGAIEEEIRDYVLKSIDDILAYKTIVNRIIPSDNGDAVITMYDDPEDLEFGRFEDWGGGWLTIPVEFTCGVLIDFYVFRSDAYSMPDWVSISGGDPETDHYFEAQAHVEVRVKLNLSVRADVREDYRNGVPILAEISADEHPEIELTNADDLFRGAAHEETWA